MAGSQPGGFDGLGEFVDFSQYESNSDLSFHVPTLSPSTSSNLSPSIALKTESPAERSPTFPTNEGFTGPSHQYGLYKQQTGFVPGAFSTALSMSDPPNYLQQFLDLQEHSGEDLFDFNAPLPTVMENLETSTLDMSFQAPSPDDIYFGSTINPNVIGGQEPDTLASPMTTPAPTTGNYPRPWPGMHQQQVALARQQQQQRMQQRERQRAIAQQAKQVHKTRSPQTSDSIAQQNVQSIMNAIRSEPVQYTPVKISPAAQFPKKQKSEAEMDPDEKFLASEEAKKLDSRERRQLRNKVSARAFRGRRKEYINWLEDQLTDKGNENGLLRAKNHALEGENIRLNNLTRQLLCAPQFQDYVNDLASNPEKLAQLGTAQQAQPQQLPQQQAQLTPEMNAHQRSQHYHEQFQQQFQQHQACYAA